ncbi:O-succinylbenzoate synthase [Scopulibacillus darangshiensis]|uniref:o-succinylbenzoate synthase n=1 Tax=Scopulibacillus darangshiensis TaxID=442528 RepID=A0A4R2P3T1_9BACL|nr:o-succinylbenzoate synthase [Scopulibacillus darangshiensis]TCP29430.1 O-succinylbenzoate synthase [Scopulibacillus darangshiensis]
MTGNAVKVKEVVLRKLQMRLKNPFATSFETMQDKTFCLLEVIDENGNIGWGESVASDLPLYNEETVKTNQHILEDLLIPDILGQTIGHPDEISERFSPIRRNNMAKATIETAIWDLFAKNNRMPLSQALGGKKKEIQVGISIGIQDTTKALLNQIEGFLTQGFRKFKIKIKPGKDVGVLREVREVYPDIPMMADANSAYTLKDIDHLKQLDDLNLMMIEQPLDHDDIVDHAVLQKEIRTPICLDESIHSVKDAMRSHSLGSCKIINIKIGRVGGLTEAKKINDYCKQVGMPVWCGGMQEAGVGRAHNIAVTTLDQFTLPGDTAPSSRYWDEDIIEPEVTMTGGIIQVPDKPGIGFEVNREMLEKFAVYEKAFKL